MPASQNIEEKIQIENKDETRFSISQVPEINLFFNPILGSGSTLKYFSSTYTLTRSFKSGESYVLFSAMAKSVLLGCFYL
jgi:hypothetical protein